MIAALGETGCLAGIVRGANYNQRKVRPLEYSRGKVNLRSLLPFLSSSLASLPEESTTGTLLSKSTFISSFCFWRNLDRLLGSTGLVEPIDMVTTLLCSRPCDWMSFHMISNTFACSIRSKARILTTTSFENFAVPYFWPAALEAVAVLWEYRPMEKSFPFPPSEPSCVHEKPKLAWYRF